MLSHVTNNTQKFTVHWSRIPNKITNDSELFVLWPSPMSADVCFREAGFSIFGDGDEHWDDCANELLTRLLDELKQFGTPRLTSEPIEKHQSLFQRLLNRTEPLSLREQIEARTVYDEFPDCAVAFGDSGVTLRTGNGHHVSWIAVPHKDAAKFAESLPSVAGEHQFTRTDFKWDCLLHSPKH